MLKDMILAALRRAYDEAKTQESLQEKTGVARGQIAKLLNGQRSCGKIYAETLEKLFPDLRIYFFRDEYPSAPSDSQDVFMRHIAKHMINMDEDRKAECLAVVAALAANSGSVVVRASPLKPDESPQKSKVAG